MKRLIPFLVGASLLISPQSIAIADEKKQQVFNAPSQQSEEQLLSRGAHYQAWKMRGDEAFSRGNYDRAIALYDQAITINGEKPFAWERRGDVLAERGDYQAAIEAYNEAINVSSQPQSQLQEKLEATRQKLAAK